MFLTGSATKGDHWVVSSNPTARYLEGFDRWRTVNKSVRQGRGRDMRPTFFKIRVQMGL